MEAVKGVSREGKAPMLSEAPRGAPRAARSRSSSMVAPSDIPQLTPRRPSVVSEPQNEGNDSSSTSSSCSSSQEPPPLPHGRVPSPGGVGAPRWRSAYDGNKEAVAAAPAAAAAGPPAPPPTGVAPSPREVQPRGSESWRQLARGGPPGAPPEGLSVPTGGPRVMLVMPEHSPRGPHSSLSGSNIETSLQPPLHGKEPWKTGGRPSVGGPQRSPRASFGLPAVPQSPRRAATRRTSEVGGATGGPFGNTGCEGGCLLQQAGAAGLRGVPCLNCHFVMPLQHIAQCAEWQIRHAASFSGASYRPKESPQRDRNYRSSMENFYEPLKPTAAVATEAPVSTGWGQQQLLQRQSGYGDSWRAPPLGSSQVATSLGRGALPGRGSTLKPLAQKLNGGSVWGSVPPSFLSSPFNVHLWAS